MSIVPTFRSSGDLLADRRYEYGRAAFEEDDFIAAADLATQALERAPGFAAAHALRGRAAAKLGRADEAVDALSQALALEPDDALGVRIDLARLGALPASQAIAAPYVRALFDDYAARFDRHLTRRLAYRGPDLIADAVRRAAALRFRRSRFGLAVDLGCGTGLMGSALADRIDRLEGVDLSPRMLAQAGKTRRYAALREGDLVADLQGRPNGSLDLALAADVFVYLADLAPALAECRRALARDGLLAFTVERHSGDDVVLGEGGRYAHARPHVEAALAAARLIPVLVEEVSTREERGEPVPGLLVVAEPAQGRR